MAVVILVLPFDCQFHIAESTNPSLEVTMPVVHIYLFPGRSTQVKNELVKRISKDFEEVANIKPESLNILFHDIAKEDWGVRGVLASETPPK
ncbi:MAG TPA: tautomerase family protein [Candidatus Binatia bacterium]|nr:tautomerase family protein [Candidatus Binatia bacterium]